jgi:nicotinate-nucleotide adenylyltransferase
MTKRKIALFGGTFDPIHLGHAKVASAAAQLLRAEKVILIPAKRSPLKGFLPIADDGDRLKMITLAIRNNDTLAVSDCELRRPAPSYTLDTVRQFQSEHGPETSIYWLLGADSVEDLVYWHKVDELIDACNVAVMYRGGYEPPIFDKLVPLWGLDRVRKLQANVIETPSIDISSTRIRERLAAGEDVSDMLHPDVAAYIRARGLYRRS